MSQGSMRCDANVSIMKPEDKEFGVRAEIKNINSSNLLKKQLILKSEGKLKF